MEQRGVVPDDRTAAPTGDTKRGRSRRASAFGSLLIGLIAISVLAPSASAGPPWPLIYPTSGSIAVGGLFGDCRNRPTGRECGINNPRSHRGVDLGNSRGTDIIASYGGTARIYRQAGEGAGLYIVITHPSGYSTRYLHLDSTVVGDGATVQKGQHIAEMGNSGTGGVHLHYEVLHNGNPININPGFPGYGGSVAAGAPLPMDFAGLPTEPLRARSDLFAIRLNGANGRTELHRMAAVYAFKGFSRQTTTGLHATSIDKWQFDVGEFDRDGIPDLYAIAMKGGSGRTEVHVLSGASNYQNFALHSATPLHQTNRENWRFVVGDLDLDGRDDVYAISMKGGSGSTEVHVLSAASNFNAFSLHTPTPLHQTNRANWQFDAGDWEGDGRDDLYAIGMKGGSNSTEVHILNAAAYGFRAFSLHTPTPLHQTNEAGWQFVAGNLEGDARTDVYSIAHRGGSGMTEAHVLNAAAYGFRAFSLHSATALHPSNLFEWQFAAAP